MRSTLLYARNKTYISMPIGDGENGTVLPETVCIVIRRMSVDRVLVLPTVFVLTDGAFKNQADENSKSLTVACHPDNLYAITIEEAHKEL